MAVNVLKFMREVQAEAKKTTWPSRKETLQTTGLVFVMVLITAVFFLTVDQIIGAGMRALFNAGN
ncbi:MAG: preprotein translocase subunit SecE [Acidocella sp. 35-58-6]|nr:MAG: preprotein translocase subunit SecE [Acidocella sp. 35-58-6]